MFNTAINSNHFYWVSFSKNFDFLGGMQKREVSTNQHHFEKKRKKKKEAAF